MDHLKNKGATSAHLDLADVESESEESFEERALAVGLAAEGDNFWDRELFAKGYCGGLEAVVGLKPRFGR